MKKSQELPTESSLDLAITGGGTGGHVYPGIAVAKEWARQFPSASVMFIGTKTGFEAKIVPHEGFTLNTIAVEGFKSRGVFEKMRAIAKLPVALWQARGHLKAFRPAVVFSTGGYVSVPVMYAAYLLRIPTVTLEPNRKPGMANALLSKIVDRVAVCFEESVADFPQGKVVFTGNPIRREFSVIGKIPPPDKGSVCNILIMGGSRGAKRINQAVIDALPYLDGERGHLIFTHQTGAEDFEFVKQGYAQRGFRADVLEYIQDTPKMYAKSHLVICRAGASTVAELRASRRPSILIPYPHGDRHQEFNAQALVDLGLAHLIRQEYLSGKALADALRHCMENPDAMAQVWTSALEADEQSASEKVVALCLQLAQREPTL